MPLSDVQVEWASCPEVADGAECASIEVRLDPLDERSDALTVSMARIPAAEQPARGQLWSVAAEAGASGTAGLSAAAGVRALAPDLDLLTLDHRGTGFSGRLGCEREELDASPLGEEIAPEEWASCTAGLEGQAEALQHLTVTGAAWDLVLASLAVQGAGDEVYWWGTSYGTWLIQRALHISSEGPTLDLAPALPTGVILDGLVPPDWTFSERDAAVDGAARQMLAECAGDPGCAEHFEGSPLEAAERVLAGLVPDGPAGCAGMDRRTVQRLTGALLVAGEPYSSLAPSIWLRLDRCDAADRRALEHLLDALYPGSAPIGARFEGRAGHAPVMERHVAYAELWDHDGPGVEAYEAALDDVISTTAVSSSFAAQAPTWPVIPPRDEWLGAWPVTRVPALALHGGHDPTVPVGRIGGFEAWLDAGAGQLLVRVPSAERRALDRGDCPASMYRGFLADPRAPVDASCVTEMAGWDWDGDPAFNEAMLGDADRWGEGRGCGCGPGIGWGGGGAAGLASAALAWRRRRTPRVIGRSPPGA
jgi:hypothetical protein